MPAQTTKVADSIQSCRVTSPAGSMNCGRKATKKIMPLGFSAVTRYVLANSLQREPMAAVVGITAGETPARSSL
ncbi:hypothetical protein D3C72_1793080 [compost metagenome]